MRHAVHRLVQLPRALALEECHDPASRDARISLCKKLVKDVAGDGTGDILREILASEQTFNLRGRDGPFLVGLLVGLLIGLCGLWLLLLWLVQRLFVWWLEWLHGGSVEPSVQCRV